MRDDSGLQYLLTDHLGSVVAVTNANGTLTSQQRYLPFGEVRQLPNYPTTQLTTDFGFTGQRDLGGTGLMDYRARFYSQSLGRFIQPDTIIPNPSSPQSWNRYSYVGNNPIMYSDPTGHRRITEGDESGPTSPIPPTDDSGPDLEDELNNNSEISAPSEDILSTILLHYYELAYQAKCENFWNDPACLDYYSIVSQDLATAFSTTGALATAFSTIVGCLSGTEAGVLPGCAGGYAAGVGFHITITNPFETVFSTISLVLAIRSDFVTHDSSFSEWELGEDSKTAILTSVLGTVNTDPFVDAGIDVYASGYNHGYFCGVSTILDCLP